MHLVRAADDAAAGIRRGAGIVTGYLRGCLELAAPVLAGSAGTAFYLGRPDLGWVDAVSALIVLAAANLLPRKKRAS